MRTPLLRVSLSLAAAAVCAVGLTACGGGDDSGSSSDRASSGTAFADQDAASIEEQAKQATTTVSSVHLNGTATSDGKQETLDLQLDTKGDCTGSIGIGGSGTAQILGTGGTYWFKPDDAFWHAFAGAKADQIIAAVGDKYVVNPDLADTCDLSGFFKDDGTEDSKPPTVDGMETVDGQPTVKITTTDSTGSQSTGYVLLSEPHYVVKIESSGADAGSFTLSDFAQPFDVKAPAADQQITLDQLGGS